MHRMLICNDGLWICLASNRVQVGRFVPMGKAYPEDLRWRAVYGVWYDGLDFVTVAEHLTKGPEKVTAGWVKKMWDLFVETAEVGR